jgi:hypothetical protein
MEEMRRGLDGHTAEQFTALLWEVYHHHKDIEHFPKGCAAFLTKKWQVVVRASTS